VNQTFTLTACSWKSPEPAAGGAGRSNLGRQASQATVTMKTVLTFLLLLGITTTVSGYQTIISPKCTVRILDQDDKPIAGLSIVREWSDSGDQQGKDNATTDKDGKVVYEKVVVKRSVIKRLFKPFLIFVPAACGPNWETYSATEIIVNIKSSDGSYRLKPVPSGFKPDASTFSNKDGTKIICAQPVEFTEKHLGPEAGRNFITISFFNRKNNKDFDLTLNISNEVTNQAGHIAPLAPMRADNNFILE
jgi:hypothetical protein